MKLVGSELLLHRIRTKYTTPEHVFPMSVPESARSTGLECLLDLRRRLLRDMKKKAGISKALASLVRVARSHQEITA